MFFKSFRKDEDVVHVDNHPSFIDFLLECSVHVGLECSGGVAQAKEHDIRLVEAKLSGKCSFPVVVRVNMDVVISRSDVHFGEELGVVKSSYQGNRKREWVCNEGVVTGSKTGESSVEEEFNNLTATGVEDSLIGHGSFEFFHFSVGWVNRRGSLAFFLSMSTSISIRSDFLVHDNVTVSAVQSITRFMAHSQGIPRRIWSLHPRRVILNFLYIVHSSILTTSRP
ncbi:hypothetical protein BDR04DRAFT_1005360 [Suillus decipiens]|nr:hypothetical protein BDR04DRAFT_1005360 [Suillus decipiens]